MQKASRLAAIAALTLTTFGTVFGAAAPVPRKAPEFVILSPDGKQTLLSSYRGKTVVLAFMFTTCPHCQKMAGILSQLQKEYAARGVQVLGATFNPTAKAEVQMFNKVFGVNFPCGYTQNENVLSFLGLTPAEPPFVPIVIFIDKTGTIRAQHLENGEAAHDAKENDFFANPEAGARAELDKLLKGGSSVSISPAAK